MRRERGLRWRLRRAGDSTDCNELDDGMKLGSSAPRRDDRVSESKVGCGSTAIGQTVQNAKKKKRAIRTHTDTLGDPRIEWYKKG